MIKPGVDVFNRHQCPKITGVFSYNHQVFLNAARQNAMICLAHPAAITRVHGHMITGFVQSLSNPGRQAFIKE